MWLEMGPTRSSLSAMDAIIFLRADLLDLEGAPRSKYSSKEAVEAVEEGACEGERERDGEGEGEGLTLLEDDVIATRGEVVKGEGEEEGEERVGEEREGEGGK